MRSVECGMRSVECGMRNRDHPEYVRGFRRALSEVAGLMDDPARSEDEVRHLVMRLDQMAQEVEKLHG